MPLSRSMAGLIMKSVVRLPITQPAPGEMFAGILYERLAALIGADFTEQISLPRGEVPRRILEHETEVTVEGMRTPAGDIYRVSFPLVLHLTPEETVQLTAGIYDVVEVPPAAGVDNRGRDVQREAQLNAWDDALVDGDNLRDSLGGAS